MRRFLLATSLLVAITPAYAATPPTVVAQPPPPALATKSLPITVAAGTGVLLRLPSPAATVMSADPGIARVQPASPDSLFLMGVAAGTTTVVATNETGAAIVQYDVTVNAGRTTATAPAAPSGPRLDGVAAQAAIAQSVQGASGITVKVAGTELVLNGTVPTAAAAQQAMAIARGYAGEKGTVVNNMLVLGAIQVNVRVRIAEISRTVTRQLGFNWQALGNGNGWKFGLRTGAGVAGVAGVVNPLIPLGLTALNGAAAIPNQIGSGFTSGNGLWDVNSVIDALAADQLVSILAEPNLTAQSGETASFLAGGEFPIPIAGATNSNGTSITVEFKQFGVSLALVPTVLSEGRLNLRIRPEVSQLSQNGAVSVPVGNGVMTIPALTVRRAETTVELGSGQSFAIAGLLQRTSVNGDNALPGIGEIPVIGALFKSNDFQRGESELVIIVTPYIVQPTSSPTALHAPTDGFRPATDLDRVLFGRQVAPPLAAGPSVDAGFILK
jgi:pilus assembly protein CpaC